MDCQYPAFICLIVSLVYVLFSEEKKLFIGMISKTAKEDDIRVMFSPFGTIEELTVLRNSDGSSKGIYFLEFVLYFLFSYSFSFFIIL